MAEFLARRFATEGLKRITAQNLAVSVLFKGLDREPAKSPAACVNSTRLAPGTDMSSSARQEEDGKRKIAGVRRSVYLLAGMDRFSQRRVGMRRKLCI
jgi:hypothetical protein